MEYKEFSKNLKDLQSKKGFKTQLEFAKYIGVSKSFVSVLLLGEKLPSMDTALEICKIFDVNLDWLMQNKGPMRPGEEIADPLYKKIIDLSPEQRSAIELIINGLNNTQKSENKPLTSEPENVRGGQNPC